MALRSKILRSSKRLQACLVHDQSHVIPGSSGNHVCRIQTALTMLAYDVDPAELRASRYGPATAKAVLAYKKDRNIVNRSYQSQADDIVGRMTIAAMDAELYALDRTATQLTAQGRCTFCQNLEGAEQVDPGVNAKSIAGA